MTSSSWLDVSVLALQKHATVPVYPCRYVVLGINLTTPCLLGKHFTEYLQPLIYETDRQTRQRDREGDRWRERQRRVLPCVVLTCLVLSAVHTRLAGPWASRCSFSCLDLWLCVRNTGGSEGMEGREDCWHVCYNSWLSMGSGDLNSGPHT